MLYPNKGIVVECNTPCLCHWLTRVWAFETLYRLSRGITKQGHSDQIEGFVSPFYGEVMPQASWHLTACLISLNLFALF